MNSVVSPESSKICELCTELLRTLNKTWGQHEHSLAELQNSAIQQCVFCSALLRDVQECYSDLSSLQWPLYRWNLRKAAQIRESMETLVITFRTLIVSKPDTSSGKYKAIPERSFHFYRESDLGKIPQETELGATTDSTQSWSLIADWIKTCTQNHPHCRWQAPNDRPMPTRLLDVSAIDIQNGKYGNIFVVETKSRNIKEPYVTLSHCWGQGPTFIRLLRDNVDKLTNEGIEWSNPDLPKNFKDAIIVARHLELQYIWIDSLCIIQLDKPDFDKEAPLMHQYYRYSYCTIAAAASSDSRGGLFRQRCSFAAGTQMNIAPAVFRAGDDHHIFGSHVWRVIPQDLWDVQLLQNPLYTRGWVFQERMLSPRLLHFSHNQIFYDCATISACEALPHGLPRPLDVTAATDRHWRQRLQQAGSSLKYRPLAGEADASIEEFWKSAVKTYTSCDLKESSDKLMAIWGVAKLIGDALGEEYGDGMWSKRLEEQLAWRVLDSARNPQKHLKPSSRRPRPLRAPTWSWASTDGMVEVQDRAPPDDREYRVSDYRGKPIAFRLKGASSCAKMTDRIVQSPEEVYEEWEVGVEKLIDKRRTSTQSSFQSSKPPALSRTVSEALEESNDAIPPKLDGWAIKIRGHVRKGRIVKNIANKKWGLCVSSHKSNDHTADTAIMEVFPDEVPESEEQQTDFMVLAYSKVVPGGPSPASDGTANTGVRREQDNKGYNSEEYDSVSESEQSSDGQHTGSDEVHSTNQPNGHTTVSKRHNGPGCRPVREQEDTHPQPSTASALSSFYGIGILLNNTEANHYERTGSFRFRDYDEEALAGLTRVHGLDDRSGSKQVDTTREGRKILLV